jgi:hypothetical protein
MATHHPFHAATISKCGKFCTLNTKATSVLLNKLKQCYVYQNSSTGAITLSTHYAIVKNGNFIYGNKVTLINKSARFTVNNFNKRDSLRNFKIEGLESLMFGNSAVINLLEI